MLNNVFQVISIFQTELCHDVWIDFRWTYSRGSTFAVPDAEELTACLIFMILSVKKANSLQAQVDRNSEATDTGGFVCRR